MRRVLTTSPRRVLGYRWQDPVTNVRVLVEVGTVRATDARQYHLSHLNMSDTTHKKGMEDQGLAEYYEKRKVLYQTMANKADNSDAVLDWYDREADSYEAQFENAGFAYLPAFVETTLTLAKDKQAKILDVAAGSGKAGMKLRRLGYTNLDGLDGSSAMLALAKEKKIYNKYICSTVGSEKLQDVPDASYDIVFCAGGVSRGHLSLETIPTMLRAVKPEQSRRARQLRVFDLTKSLEAWTLTVEMMRRLLTTAVHRILGYRRQDRVPNARVLVEVGMATDTRQYHRSHLKMADTANKEGAEDQGLAEYYGKRKILYQAMANKAGNSDAIIDWYDKEADIYEANFVTKMQQFEKAGFEYPSAFVETTLILAKDKQSKILDVAAGSGKVGMKLRKLGYTNLDGLDGSSAMLALAKENDIYNNYICCTVGPEKLRDITDASYDLVFCAGGVSRNHLSLETIPTMLRAVKPNGYLYFNHSSWSAQFPDYSFEKLDRIIKILEQKGLCSSADIKKEWNVRPGEPTTLYILQRGKGAF